jgi:hypothetical protein
MDGRTRGVAYKEGHWDVVLQSPALYQSFRDPAKACVPDFAAAESLRVPHYFF